MTNAVQPQENTSKQADKNQQNKYDKYRSLSEGLLDITALMANASQLKAVMYNGPSVRYYAPLLVLLGLSIGLQFLVGVLLLMVGSGRHRKQLLVFQFRMTQAVLILMMVIIIINIFVAAFGIESAPC